MSEGKRQSLIMTGIGLILLSVLILYFAFSQPKVSDETALISSTSATADTVSSQNQSAFSSAAETTVNSTVTNTVSAAQTSSAYTETEEQTSSTAFSGKINLNTCTADDLTAINGIGASRAEAIIQYREYLGGYTNVEQIKEIRGIGDKIYEKVSPYLTV